MGGGEQMNRKTFLKSLTGVAVFGAAKEENKGGVHKIEEWICGEEIPFLDPDIIYVTHDGKKYTVPLFEVKEELIK